VAAAACSGYGVSSQLPPEMKHNGVNFMAAESNENGAAMATAEIPASGWRIAGQPGVL